MIESVTAKGNENRRNSPYLEIVVVNLRDIKFDGRVRQIKQFSAELPTRRKRRKNRSVFYAAVEGVIAEIPFEAFGYA